MFTIIPWMVKRKSPRVNCSAEVNDFFEELANCDFLKKAISIRAHKTESERFSWLIHSYNWNKCDTSNGKRWFGILILSLSNPVRVDFTEGEYTLSTLCLKSVAQVLIPEI